jgi:hypothetical protein
LGRGTIYEALITKTLVIDKFTVRDFAEHLLVILLMLYRYRLYHSHWMMRKMKIKHTALMTVMLKSTNHLLKRRYEKILTSIQVSYLTEREKMKRTDFERNSDKYVVCCHCCQMFRLSHLVYKSPSASGLLTPVTFCLYLGRSTM